MDECLRRTEAVAQSILDDFGLSHEPLLSVRVFGNFGYRGCLDPLTDHIVELSKSGLYRDAYLLFSDILAYVLKEVPLVRGQGGKGAKRAVYITERVSFLFRRVKWKIDALVGYVVELRELDCYEQPFGDAYPFEAAMLHTEKLYNDVRQGTIGRLIKHYKKRYLENDRHLNPSHNAYRDTSAYDHTILSGNPYLDANKIVVGKVSGSILHEGRSLDDSSSLLERADSLTDRSSASSRSEPVVRDSGVWEYRSHYISFHFPAKHSVGILFKQLAASSVKVVVMLNEPSERSGAWYQYWPESLGGYKVFYDDRTGDASGIVELKSEKDYFFTGPRDAATMQLEYITVRELVFYDLPSVAPTEFYQVHLRNWEDHGVPANWILLHLVYFVNILNNPANSLATLEAYAAEWTGTNAWSGASDHHSSGEVRESTTPRGDSGRVVGSHRHDYTDGEPAQRRIAMSAATGGNILSAPAVVNPFWDSIRSPIAVHCHGGVGRTGTFIAVHHLMARIDQLLNSSVMLKKDSPSPGHRSRYEAVARRTNVNVIEIWVRLCLQRPSVQGPVQLAFIYGMVHFYLEYICKVTTSPAAFPPVPPKYSRRENCFRLAAAMDSHGIFSRSKEQYEKTKQIKSGKDQDEYLYFEGERVGKSVFRYLSDCEVENWVCRLCKLSRETQVFVGWMVDQNMSVRELEEAYGKRSQWSLPSGPQLLLSSNLHALVNAMQIPLEYNLPRILKGATNLSSKDHELICKHSRDLKRATGERRVNSRSFSANTKPALLSRDVSPSRLVKSTNSPRNT